MEVRYIVLRCMWKVPDGKKKERKNPIGKNNERKGNAFCVQNSGLQNREYEGNKQCNQERRSKAQPFNLCNFY